MEYENKVLGRGEIVVDKNKNEVVLGIEEQVGWTPQGRQYYDKLKLTFKFLKSNEQYWIHMNNHRIEYENEVLGRGEIVGDKNKNEVVLGIEDYPEEQFMVDFRGII